MKKTAVFLVLLLAVIAAVCVGYFLRSRSREHASAFVPAETVLFLEFPDIAESRKRWKKTALYQIAHEPEVQAFLEKPKSKLPRQGPVRTEFDNLLRVDPQDAFFAITSATEARPKIVGGFSFRGAKKDVDSLVADARAKAQASWPAAKSDFVKQGDVEIETFTNAKMTVALAFDKSWCLFANDLDLLKTTIDRVDGRVKSDALKAAPAFQKTIAKFPRESDALVFLQPGILMERLIGLIKATGQQVDTPQLDELRKIQGYGAAMKFEGAQIRDAIYVLKSGSEKQPALPRSALAFSSSNTLLYYSGLIGKPASFKLPDASLDTTGLLRMLAQIEQGLAAKGLTLADFVAAFGPEIGTLLDWAPTAPQPALLVALDVRDAVKARSFVDFFTSGQIGGPAWVSKDIDGAHFYTMPPLGLAFVTPTLALNEKVLLAGLSYDSVNAALKEASATGHKLDASPEFQAAVKSVAEPTMGFGYINSRDLFERLFGTLRPFLMYWSLFVPNSSNYVDLKKLPSTESISKHLTPIVTSKSSDEDGILVESTGPVTFTQALFGIGVTAGVSLSPMLKPYLQKTGTRQPAIAAPVFGPSSAAPGPAATPASTPEPAMSATPSPNEPPANP